MNVEISSLIIRLEKRLSEPLPGEDIQFQMAPLGRKRIPEIRNEAYNPKKSAVLILLFPVGRELRMVLIERPEYEGVHSGQIAFPGGRFEESDRDLVHTALRETEEEIGLLQEKVRVIGPLTDIFITPSNYLVSPFIGFVPEKPEFKPDSREVKSILTVDLLSLQNEEKRSVKSILHSSGHKLKTPYYDIEGFTVWGATAMMIAELNAIVKEITSS